MAKNVTSIAETPPESCAWPLEGLPPVIFFYDQLKSGDRYSKKKAWDLLNEGDSYLERDNFVDYDSFLKYYFLSLGLVDYAAVIASGLERSGKSLFQAWAVYQLARLFGKRVTLDWSPPVTKIDALGNFTCPIELRNANRLQDQDYVDKIQDEINRLGKMQKIYGERPPQEELDKLIIYNCAFGYDESQTWGDRASRTNFTRLNYLLLTIRGHMGTSMFFTFLDPSRADQLIYNRLTHLVTCDKNREYYDTCTYSIFHKRNGVAKKLHLRPKDWLHIWDSHSIPQISHDITIHLGGNKRAKKVVTEDLEV